MPAIVLELAIAAEDAGPILKLPALARERHGHAKSRPLRILWHDQADGALAAKGLAVVQEKRRWRLERIAPGPDRWLPGTPAPILADCEAPADLPLGSVQPDRLRPVVAFEGRVRTVELGSEHRVSLEITAGTLRTVALDRPFARLRLTGAADAVGLYALALAEAAGASLPRASIAAEALALAHGTTPAARHLGSPALRTACSVEEAACAIIGALADTLAYWATLVNSGKREPVHQMRVASRRLRSSLAVFKPAIHCPALQALRTELKQLDTLLGPARDWDVFLHETGEHLRGSFPDDRPIARLLASAVRQKQQHHAELSLYLASAAFRRLGIMLALLTVGRPWRTGADPEHLATLDGPLDAYAAAALHRRMQKLPAEEEIAHYPADQLHRVRIHAKQLRYTSEFFSGIFPGKTTKKFLKRLAALQERLGALNDGVVATALLAELGGRPGQALARGTVRGFMAARAVEARPLVARAWSRFRALEPFWE